MTHQNFEIGLIDNVPTIWDLNAFDKSAWNRVSHRVAHSFNARDFPGNPEQDAFFALRNRSPKFTEGMDTGLDMLAEIFKRGMATTGFANLKAKTVGNEVLSAALSSNVIDGVFSNIPDEVKREAAQKAVAEKTARDNLEKAMQSMAMAREAVEQGDNNLAEAFRQAATEKERAGKVAGYEAGQSGEKIDQFFETSGDIMTDEFSQACNEASKQADKISTVMRAYGEASGQNPKDFSIDLVSGLLNFIQTHPNIDFFIDCLGWAEDTIGTIERKIANARLAVFKQSPKELDLEDIIEDELMAFTGGMGTTLHAEFLDRAADDLVIHDIYQGKSPQGSGPVVKVSDRSGSMGGKIPGTDYTNHAMNQAITFVLFGHCQRTERRVVDISFGGHGDYTVCDSSTMAPDDLFKHLSYGARGGTQPEKPIKEAIDIVKNDDLKADIWFMTDGIIPPVSGDLKGAWRVCKDQTGSKFLGTVIGNFSTHEVDALADTTFYVDDLFTDREKIKQLLIQLL